MNEKVPLTRHMLMGATLRPWFRHLSALNAYESVFFMVDESCALTALAA